MKLSHFIFSRATAHEAAPARVSVKECIEDKSLDVVFQPTVCLQTGSILGHEALVRGPKGCTVEKAVDLQAAAQSQKCPRALELACAEFAVQRWVGARGRGKLFINFSAQVLTVAGKHSVVDELLAILRRYRTQPARVVLEVNGYSKHPSPQLLVEALQCAQAAGMLTAMDDLKGSENSLHAWQALGPGLVKLDARLTQGLAEHEGKAKTVRSLVAMAARRQTVLVAKGVESAGDLRALTQAGVEYAQGFFMGSPDASPVGELNFRASSIIAEEARARNCDLVLP